MADDKKQVKRKNLGLLINQMHHRYQGMIFPGIIDGAIKRNYNLISFIGKPLNSPSHFENQENLIYKLASLKNIDGLLILSGSIGNNLSVDELKIFCHKYAPLPSVCIATPIEGIPSVWVENEIGMRDIVTHFVREHKRKRIAFIRGPVKNPEAEMRYKVFREVLAENGLPLIEDLIYEGTFVWYSGIEGVKTLLDRRKAKFDAILAANDEMLIGAYRELLKRGIKIPDEVAIGGFDNIDETRIVTPQITTVLQPLYEEGMKAVDMLADMLEGKDAPLLYTFPARLIIRQSCGCMSNITSHPIERNAGLTSGEFTESVFDENKRNKILKMISEDSELQAETPKGFHEYKDVIKDFVNDFMTELLNRNDDPFSKMIGRIVSESSEGNSNLEYFRIMITKLYRYISLHISENNDLEFKAFQICNNAYSKLLDAISRKNQNMLIRSRDFNWSMLNVTKTLSTTFDMNDLKKVFMQLLPSLGISFCFIAIYEDKIDESLIPSKMSCIFLNYRDGCDAEENRQSMVFNTDELMPDPIWNKTDKSCFLIYPLVTENNHFGYIIFQHHFTQDPIIYETLQGHISASLNTASLMETVKKQTNDLETLLADQKKKSRELEDAYKSLKENQEKILINEKMASLGRMTAGLSHEMKTPLASIRSSLFELEHLKNEYFLSIDDRDVTSDDHHNIINDMQKSIDNAKKAAEFLTIFIKGIKSQTTDIMPKENRIFNAVPVIQDAILLLNHKLRTVNCSVKFDFTEQNILLYGFTARLSQVVTNLINNAVYACKDKKDGIITVGICSSIDGIDLTVADNGSGIEKAILSKIFDPLFSTKPFTEGTGLGLTIVYDIITAEFKGSIEVKSEVGIGTSFIIHFPKPEQKEAV